MRHCKTQQRIKADEYAITHMARTAPEARRVSEWNTRPFYYLAHASGYQYLPFAGTVQ